MIYRSKYSAVKFCGKKTGHTQGLKSQNECKVSQP